MADLFMMEDLATIVAPRRRSSDGGHKRQRYLEGWRMPTAAARDAGGEMSVTKVFDGAEMGRLYCEAWEENE